MEDREGHFGCIHIAHHCCRWHNGRHLVNINVSYYAKEHVQTQELVFAVPLWPVNEAVLFVGKTMNVYAVRCEGSYLESFRLTWVYVSGALSWQGHTLFTGGRQFMDGPPVCMMTPGHRGLAITDYGIISYS